MSVNSVKLYIFRKWIFVECIIWFVLKYDSVIYIRIWAIYASRSLVKSGVLDFQISNLTPLSFLVYTKMLPKNVLAPIKTNKYQTPDNTATDSLTEHNSRIYAVGGLGMFYMSLTKDILSTRVTSWNIKNSVRNPDSGSISRWNLWKLNIITLL